MLTTGIFKNLLFLDIETVPLTKTYQELPQRLQKAWEHKATYINKQQLPLDQLYFQKAGIYSEFGKIITISLGILYLEKAQLKSKIKTLSNTNEYQLLQDLLQIINKYNQENLILCAHNG